LFTRILPLKKDDTEYYLLSSDYVSVAEFAGQEVLKLTLRR
jgi:fumarate hydratase class I